MATIAAALVGAGGAYYASRQANKRTGDEKDAARLLNQNATQAGAYGSQMLDRSKMALNPVYEWFSQLATGDREALMQYLGPEIAAQSTASRQAFQTGSELAPRSGPGTEAVSRIPTDNAASLGRIIAGARPAGMQGLATLGTNAASLGLQGLGQGAAGAGQVLGYNADRRAQSGAASAAAGEGAYELFKLIQEAYAGRGKGTTGTGTGTGAGGTSFWGNKSNTDMLSNYISMFGSGGGG